jgi:hypothetical protein
MTASGKWDAKRCGSCRRGRLRAKARRDAATLCVVGSERTLAPVGARRAWIYVICPWLRVHPRLLKFDVVFVFFKMSEFDVPVDRDTYHQETATVFFPPVLLENSASPKIHVIRACIYKRTTCYKEGSMLRSDVSLSRKLDTITFAL